jgi:uncharacterized protein (DUF1684 family)
MNWMGSRRSVAARRAVLIVATAAFAACNPPPPDEGGYVERVTQSRAAKDAEFQRTNDPVPESRKSVVLPLTYYPVDPAFKVPAVLKPDPKAPVVTMITSTGTREEHRVLGTLEFTVKGQVLSLTAFASPDSRVFVPFQDQTSGTETYGAGRYIDLIRTGTNVYEIDFNNAYNPYCYYSLAYVCPLPPKENRLAVPIHAGEKIRPEAEKS